MYIILAKSFDCAICDEAQSEASEETRISVVRKFSITTAFANLQWARWISCSNGRVARTLKFRKVDIGQETAGVNCHCR